MNKLTVYADYVQTQSLLRAARNRVLNAMRTVIPIASQDRSRCCVNASAAYSDHMLHAEPKLSAISAAIAARNVDQLAQAVSALHRYNRATVRLTRVLETDLTDTPIDPDKFYPNGDDGPSITPPTVSMATPITTQKFGAKLHAALEQGRSV
jgi:uncharacterized protein YjiS (DUF1127 family)